MNDSKPCIKCGRVKRLEQFYRNHKMAGGFVNVCIKCKIEKKNFREQEPSELSNFLHLWAMNANQRIENVSQQLERERSDIAEIPEPGTVAGGEATSLFQRRL